MDTKFNLSGMWAEALVHQPEAIAEIKLKYLYLTSVDVIGKPCGHNFKSEFIGNIHPSRDIKAKVQTTAIYMGQVIERSLKDIIVSPGKKNEQLLGCTGFANDSGGYDTKYDREILEADWA
jgi:hypothetical protein